MRANFKAGEFDDEAHRCAFNNEHSRVYRELSQAGQTPFKVRDLEIMEAVEKLRLFPASSHPNDIAAAAGRLSGLWEYFARMSGHISTDSYVDLVSNAIERTMLAVDHAWTLDKDTRGQYFLNALPLWFELVTLKDQILPSEYSLEILQSAEEMAASLPWTDIRNLKLRYAANAALREQQAAEQLAKDRAFFQARRNGKDRTADCADYRTIFAAARDVSMQVLEHTPFGRLPAQVAAAPVLNFHNEEGFFSLGMVAECAGNLAGLWDFHDKHAHEAERGLIGAALVNITMHADKNLDPFRHGNRAVKLYRELAGSFFDRVAPPKPVADAAAAPVRNNSPTATIAYLTGAQRQATL